MQLSRNFNRLWAKAAPRPRQEAMYLSSFRLVVTGGCGPAAPPTSCCLVSPSCLVSTPTSQSLLNLPHVFPSFTCRQFTTKSVSMTSLVPTYDMKRFLRVKGLTFTESHPCIQVSIPAYVFGVSQSYKWSSIEAACLPVFLNKVTGVFVIPQLAASGTWVEFQSLVNTWITNRMRKKDEPQLAYPTVKKLTLKLPAKEQNVWDAASPIEQLEPQQFRDLLKNFKQVKRDFMLEDFTRFNVRVDKKSLDVLYFPVQYVTGDLVGLRVLRMSGSHLVEEDLPSASGTGILPFIHNLDTAVSSQSKSCVVVGSALDTVVLSARTNLQVIALPDLTNLHPDLLPFLDQFTSITLWLGSDVQTVDITSLFARKIEEKRCRVVTFEHPSAVTAVRKKMDVQGILDSARACHHEFITTFDKLRLDVYLEFVNSDKMEGVKWRRFEGFNGLLRGFRRGEMTVVTGRTGSGKTTFMSEYSLDLCVEGVNTLWGSFEVKNVRLIKMLMKQFSLINLDENIEEFDKVAEKFLKLPMYFSTFHGSQEIDVVMDAMSHAVYVHDIAHVIIDNVQFMIGAGNGSLDRISRQDACIEKFRQFATLHNCHVTLVIHPRKEMEEMLTIHSVFGGGKATQEADNVLLLQEEKSEGTFFKKKYIEVVKNRYTGDLGVVPLTFTKSFLTMSKKVADYARRNMQKKTMPIMVKKKNGDIVKESEEILIKPTSEKKS